MADQASTSADPALDFLSASFDPVLALSTPNLEPPDLDARPLDNVAKCRSILPAELPESLANVEKKTASEVGGSMDGAAGAWVGQCARYMDRTSSHGMRAGCLACLLPHCLAPRSPPRNPTGIAAQSRPVQGASGAPGAAYPGGVSAVSGARGGLHQARAHPGARPVDGGRDAGQGGDEARAGSARSGHGSTHGVRQVMGGHMADGGSLTTHVVTLCATTVSNDAVRVRNAGLLSSLHQYGMNHAAVQVHTSH